MRNLRRSVTLSSWSSGDMRAARALLFARTSPIACARGEEMLYMEIAGRPKNGRGIIFTIMRALVEVSDKRRGRMS